jgi:hypothetical protein
MDNGHEAATKADVAALKADLSTLEQRLTEAIRDNETHLLKAFYGFTEWVSARFKASEDSEANLKKRLAVVEERLMEVEKRLNFPGH